MTTETKTRTVKPKLYKVTADGTVHIVRALTKLGAQKFVKRDITAAIATQDDLVQYLPQVEVIDATKQADL